MIKPTYSTESLITHNSMDIIDSLKEISKNKEQPRDFILTNY